MRRPPRAGSSSLTKADAPDSSDDGQGRTNSALRFVLLRRWQLQLLAVAIFQVHIQLAEGDDDTAFAELAVQAAVDLIDHRVAVGQITNMQAQLVLKATFAEAEEEHLWLGLLQYPRIIPRRLEHQLARLIQIGAKLHADADGYPGDGIAQGPVHQLVGDEGLVRDDDFLVIEIGDGGGADADTADRAGEVADGDHIADAHRLLEQDDQAGHEVGEDLLQAEAQADGKRGHQPLQLVPADAQGR